MKNQLDLLPPGLQPIPRGSQFARCRSCGAGIYWTVTATGKRMPVVVLEGEPGHVTPTQDRDGVGVSHFADCPEADHWRKR